MFQGKVYSYQNINGKEKSFEKTFDSYDEYRSFMGWENLFSNFLGSGLNMFDNYLDHFFDRKLALGSWEPHRSEESLPVDMSKYEQASRKIDMDESEKKRRREQLENAKSRLTEYQKKFKESGEKDLLKDIESDMKKIDQELSSIR